MHTSAAAIIAAMMFTVTVSAHAQPAGTAAADGKAPHAMGQGHKGPGAMGQGHNMAPGQHGATGPGQKGGAGMGPMAGGCPMMSAMGGGQAGHKH